MLSLTAFVGTDAELEAKLANFSSHINTQKQNRKTEENSKEDLEEELANTRQRHTELVNQRGLLTGEAEVGILIPSVENISHHLDSLPGSKATHCRTGATDPGSGREAWYQGVQLFSSRGDEGRRVQFAIG